MIGIAGVLLGVFLTQVSPGPNMMAVASASFGSGRGVGLATAAGVATGVFVWAILFAFGIGAVLQTVPQAITAMKFIGGAYLAFLGIKALRSAFRPRGNVQAARGLTISASAAFRLGLLVVMTNPKAALMWVAISMFLASSGLSVLHFLLMGLGASASAMLVYGTYAVLFSTGTVVRAYQRFFRVIEGAFGVVFGAVGGQLIMSGIREMKS
jgi:threonine/homoserine/homoserine lactone efflux protein